MKPGKVFKLFLLFVMTIILLVSPIFNIHELGYEIVNKSYQCEKLDQSHLNYDFLLDLGRDSRLLEVYTKDLNLTSYFYFKSKDSMINVENSKYSTCSKKSPGNPIVVWKINIVEDSYQKLYCNNTKSDKDNKLIACVFCYENNFRFLIFGYLPFLTPIAIICGVIIAFTIMVKNEEEATRTKEAIILLVTIPFICGFTAINAVTIINVICRHIHDFGRYNSNSSVEHTIDKLSKYFSYTIGKYI